jgi:hypothetical protein
LANKILPQEITLGLQQFIDKAESGQDLTPHPSTKLDDNPDYKDLMFYDWGIFHFHLGTNPHPNRQGFLKRTKYLLFAIADSDTATMYLIDIHPHLFTNQDLLRILEENWSEILDPYTTRGVGLPYNASDKDIDSLRKAGINPILQTPGGRVLRPMGGGITSAGNSSRIKTEAYRIKTEVRELEEWFIQQRDTLAVEFKDKYAKNWDCLKFKLKSFEAPVNIEEITTVNIEEITTGEIIEYPLQGGR